MVLGKKAIFFSIMSVLLSSLIIIIFSSFFVTSLDREAQAEAQAVDFIDDLVAELPEYVGRQLEASTYYAIEAIIISFNDEVYFNRTVDYSSLEQLEFCVQYGVMHPVRADYCALNYAGFGVNLRSPNPTSRTGLFNELEEAFPGTTFDYQITNVSIAQTSTYFVQVNASLLVNISRPPSYWSRQLNLSENVSLIGQTDPYWLTRKIKLRPGDSGFAFRSTFFGSEYDLVANFSEGGYVYRDTSAPGFFDILDGNLPRTIDANFSEFGYTSITPGYISGVSTYESNQTTSIRHLNFLSSFGNLSHEVTFSPSELSRIDHPNLSTNQTFPNFYLTEMFQGSLGNPELLSVAGCCDDTGCDPLCS